MRRALQDGHSARPLQEKATRKSWRIFAARTPTPADRFYRGMTVIASVLLLIAVAGLIVGIARTRRRWGWNPNPELVSFLPLLRQHFDRIQDRFASFARHGVQAEGWFKGEMHQVAIPGAEIAKKCYHCNRLSTA
jgi:hypothetical protein